MSKESFLIGAARQPEDPLLFGMAYGVFVTSVFGLDKTMQAQPNLSEFADTIPFVNYIAPFIGGGSFASVQAVNLLADFTNVAGDVVNTPLAGHTRLVLAWDVAASSGGFLGILGADPLNIPFASRLFQDNTSHGPDIPEDAPHFDWPDDATGWHDAVNPFGTPGADHWIPVSEFAHNWATAPLGINQVFGNTLLLQGSRELQIIWDGDARVSVNTQLQPFGGNSTNNGRTNNWAVRPAQTTASFLNPTGSFP